MIAEIKEQMGEKGMRQEIFAIYKRKFPRHSSFQTEMKNYLANTGPLLLKSRPYGQPGPLPMGIR